MGRRFETIRCHEGAHFAVVEDGYARDLRIFVHAAGFDVEAVYVFGEVMVYPIPLRFGQVFKKKPGVLQHNSRLRVCNSFLNPIVAIVAVRNGRPTEEVLPRAKSFPPEFFLFTKRDSRQMTESRFNNLEAQ